MIILATAITLTLAATIYATLHVLDAALKSDGRRFR